jgi:hypothetical protein
MRYFHDSMAADGGLDDESVLDDTNVELHLSCINMKSMMASNGGKLTTLKLKL